MAIYLWIYPVFHLFILLFGWFLNSLKHNLPSHFHHLHIFRVWKVDFLSHKPQAVWVRRFVPLDLQKSLRTVVFNYQKWPHVEGSCVFCLFFSGSVYDVQHISISIWYIYIWIDIYIYILYPAFRYEYVLTFPFHSSWRVFKRCEMDIDKALYAGCKIYRCWEHCISDLRRFSTAAQLLPRKECCRTHRTTSMRCPMCVLHRRGLAFRNPMLNPTMTYHAEKCRYTNRCELFVELYLLQVRNLNIYCPSPTEIFWKWHQSSIRALCINTEK